jgi:YD repeat-containing protein
VTNRSDSPLGAGWTLEALERFVPNPHGVSLIRGNGDQTMFWQKPGGVFSTDPRFEFLEASYPAGGGGCGGEGFFTVPTWPDSFDLRGTGGHRTFNSLGLLVQSWDARGNTTYAYIDADGDGAADEIHEIVDPAHRTMSFCYTGGRVTGITDFQGRSYQLGYDGSGRLVSINAVAAPPCPASPASRSPSEDGPPRLIPHWNAERRELHLNGKVVKRFRLPSPNQEAVLAAFEEERWPPHVDDPLPPKPEQDPKRRLNDTIKSLNQRQIHHLIRFQGDGHGRGV